MGPEEVVILLQEQKVRSLVTPQQRGALKKTPTDEPHKVTASSGPQEISGAPGLGYT